MKIFGLINVLIVMLMMHACQKKNTQEIDIGRSDTTVVLPAEDPATPPSIGFFLDNWQSKIFKIPSLVTTVDVPEQSEVTVNINRNHIITKIPPTLFGNNVNTYMTQMIDQPDLVRHIKNLNPGLIRFPGGNLSSVYFWNALPGNAPADAPPKIIDGASGSEIDAGYWFGENNDSWTLSVDNYYNMLQQTNSKGVITVNYGYARYGRSDDPVAAAAHMAAEWVRYDNGRTQYWEVGNESNGVWQAGNRIDVAHNKDGQPEFVTGELYGKHFGVFADSMRKAAQEVGATIYIGAQLLEQEPASWATVTDKNWNAGVLANAANEADYFVVHNYYTPYNTNSTAAEILATPAAVTAHMQTYVTKTIADHGAVLKPIALTEYNIFAVGSKQMVSHINGMHATMVVGELMKNKIGMACRWDLANAWEEGNDHGMFSQGEAASGEPKWNPRPVFYHMYYFQKMMGDRAIASSVSGTDAIHSYASSFSSGEVGVAIVNTGNTQTTIKLQFENFVPGKKMYYYVLTGGEGIFSRKLLVNGKGPDGIAGGPNNYDVISAMAADITGMVKVHLPAYAIVYAVIEGSH